MLLLCTRSWAEAATVKLKLNKTFKGDSSSSFFSFFFRYLLGIIVLLLFSFSKEGLYSRPGLTLWEMTAILRKIKEIINGFNLMARKAYATALIYIYLQIYVFIIIKSNLYKILYSSINVWPVGATQSYFP